MVEPPGGLRAWLAFFLRPHRSYHHIADFVLVEEATVGRPGSHASCSVSSLPLRQSGLTNAMGRSANGRAQMVRLISNLAKPSKPSQRPSMREGQTPPGGCVKRRYRGLTIFNVPYGRAPVRASRGPEPRFWTTTATSPGCPQTVN